MIVIGPWWLRNCKRIILHSRVKILHFSINITPCCMGSVPARATAWPDKKARSYISGTVDCTGLTMQNQLLRTRESYEPGFDEIHNVALRNSRNFDRSMVECPMCRKTCPWLWFYCDLLCSGLDLIRPSYSYSTLLWHIPALTGHGAPNYRTFGQTGCTKWKSIRKIASG